MGSFFWGFHVQGRECHGEYFFQMFFTKSSTLRHGNQANDYKESAVQNVKPKVPLCLLPKKRAQEHLEVAATQYFPKIFVEIFEF